MSLKKVGHKFKNRIQIGFSDGYVERRISKNQLIAWQPIEKELKKVYKSGKRNKEPRHTTLCCCCLRRNSSAFGII